MIRRAVTLIELLVVITIMLIITAAAIPTFAPSMANRRVREAARLTSSFIAGARARAIETGRPVGVEISPVPGSPGAVALFYVETPAPYCGDTIQSTVKFDAGDSTSGWQPTAEPLSDQLTQIAKVGDHIRFNYQGHLFQINQITNGRWFLTSETVPSNQLPGYINSTRPTMPYQLIRQPIRSAASPLQLPESMVIDLSASGVGGDVFTQGGPVVVTFNSTGSVHSLSVNGGAPYKPTSPIFFLVGQRAKLTGMSYTANMDQATAVKTFNFRDLGNIWVSINPQSGLVTSSPMALVTPTNPPPANPFQADVATSRALARDAQTLGGN